MGIAITTWYGLLPFYARWQSGTVTQDSSPGVCLVFGDKARRRGFGFKVTFCVLKYKNLSVLYFR